MRKLKLVKVVIPELVAYLIHGKEKLPEYRCPECGAGVSEEYICCPYCGVGFDWNRKDEKSAEFQKLINSI